VPLPSTLSERLADEIQQQGLVTATQKLNRKQIRDLNKEAIANCINELKK
jgi:hypothetical protein